jgi:hypothetical protein
MLCYGLVRVQMTHQDVLPKPSDMLSLSTNSQIFTEIGKIYEIQGQRIHY